MKSFFVIVLSLLAFAVTRPDPWSVRSRMVTEKVRVAHRSLSSEDRRCEFKGWAPQNPDLAEAELIELFWREVWDLGTLGRAARAEFATWGPTVESSNLTVEEKVALRLYTQASYGPLNEALRNCDQVEIPYLLALITMTDRALAKLPAYQGTVYRKTFRGQVYLLDNGYVSTSTAPVDKFPGNVTLIIQTRTGRMIDRFSRIPDEREVLIPRGARFKITDEKMLPTGEAVVMLEELP